MEPQVLDIKGITIRRWWPVERRLGKNTATLALARWFGAEAKRVYKMLAESPEERANRELVELIRKCGDKMTVRSLMRSCRKYKTAEDAEAALDNLRLAGVGERADQAPGKQGGRPSTVFRMIDPADVDKTTNGADEPHGIQGTVKGRAVNLNFGCEGKEQGL
jgi:hypothetical protein